ncbi:MAG: alpha-galactosidase, partial [Eubacteriales bacterium]
RFDTVDKWESYVCPGHYYDLDMLAIGRQDLFSELPSLTDNEELVEYTMTAFFSSPIQLSCHLDKLTEFEFDMICNDEIIEINQDALASYPKMQKTYGQRDTSIYRRELWGGDFAVAVFNMGEAEFCDTFELGGTYHIRDVWAKEDVGTADRLPIDLIPHSVVVYRMSKK